MNILKHKLKLVKGTRFVSFLFIGCSIMIAAGILIAANMYYNIDTNEVIVEEIQRVTGMLRATAGLIVGGGPDQDPALGYGFQVATSTLFSEGDVVLSAENQLLRFMGGHGSNYVSFRAPSDLAATSTYIWPEALPEGMRILVSDASGELSWRQPGDGEIGGIIKIGDCEGPECFVQSGSATSTSLWFHDNDRTGELTIGTLASVDRTYTLPDLDGTIALQAEDNLSVSGGVIFADSLGRLIQDSNFEWSTSSRALSLGSANNAGQLRIYSSNAGGYYLGFRATSTMAGNTEYYWPTGYGTEDFVLTTDGSGQLIWKSVEGVGGITGDGQDGRVTFWTGENTLSSSEFFTWNSTTSILTLGGGLVAPLLEYAGQLEIRTTDGGNILLNPEGNIVQLATSTYIRTQEGYEIGKAGTEILREMIPIMGFDLPVQTATNTYVTISRTINNYPFEDAATGTERIYKLAIRYAAAGTGQSDWQVWQVSGTPGQFDTFSLEGTNEANFSQASGEAAIVEVEIPTDQTWRLDVDPNGDTIRIFQIFLAAYDRIQ